MGASASDGPDSEDSGLQKSVESDGVNFDVRQTEIFEDSVRNSVKKTAELLDSNSTTSECLTSESSASDAPDSEPTSMEWPPPEASDPWERRRQTLAVSLFLAIFLITMPASALLLYWLATNPWLRWPLLVYLAWVWLLDWDFYERGGRRWEWLRRASIWNGVAAYFPMRLVKTAELPPDRNYLLCFHPHGVIAFSAVVSMVTDGTGFCANFPGLRQHLATLDMHFKQPFRRELIAAFGAIGSSFRALRWVLERPEGGQAVGLAVGGAEEALEAHPDSFKLCLERRRGFIRLALCTGCSLVPVYSFGETGTYSQVPNPPGSRLRAVQGFVKRWVGLSPVLVTGAGLFRGWRGILPLRRPVATVVGAPIPVQRVENPTDDQIQQLHVLYRTKLIELFEAHKLKFGVPADAHLQFY